MKINSDNETLAENKVLIMYVLSCSKKDLTNDALYEIVNSAVDMNFFYFQQFLLDLANVNYISSYESDGQKFYKITDAGKNTLALTLDILPGITKLKVDTTFKKSLEKITNDESVVAEYIPKNENEYEVICKIIENNETIFSIKIYAYSREEAQKIVDNWKTNATSLYPEILGLLNK